MTESEPEDISDWECGRDSSGTKTGSWVFHPRTRRMGLVKIPKYHPLKNFEEGETWAEVVASRLGHHLGLSLPEVQPVKWRGRLCPLSWNICPVGWELREGVGLATSAEMQEPLLVTDVMKLLEHHLGSHDATAGVTRLVSFDILIGNCDRHWYNWGLLLPAVAAPENTPVMAHFYDNGSALGANLMPDRLRRYIADNDQQERFDRNFKYEMRLNTERKPLAIELLAFLGNLNRGLFGLREELSKMNAEMIDAVVGHPPAWLRDRERVEFTKILLRRRRELILSCTGAR